MSGGKGGRPRALSCIFARTHPLDHATYCAARARDSSIASAPKQRVHRLSSFTFLEPVGRRLWHNYCWIFFIHVTSYVDKLLIHPTPISSVDEFFARATIGPVPGNVLAANECARLIAEPDWRLKCAKPAPLDIGPILDPRAAQAH